MQAARQIIHRVPLRCLDCPNQILAPKRQICADASQAQLTITFLTDVEGDGAYFDRYVHHSKVLGFRDRKPCFGDQIKRGDSRWNLGEWEKNYFPYDREVVFLEPEDNSVLVYGGDIWDKGGADLYVIRQLLSLHDRYPDRVHFLMGNRDINKLRIVDELGVWRNDEGNACGASELLPFHGGVYWLCGTNLPGDPLRINDELFCSQTNQMSTSCGVPSTNRAERLKWMLQKTMGSVDAFELRRKELKRERESIFSKGRTVQTKQQSLEPVTDDEVAQSYIRSCDPNHGIMSQYLTRAKLMVKFGPALFIHGALPYLPGENEVQFPAPWIRTNSEEESCHGFDSLTDWIHGLNRFAADQISAWKEYGLALKNDAHMLQKGVWASEGGYSNESPGGKMFGKLLQYGMNTLPDQSKNLSVVYSSWMDDGMPREDLANADWHDFFMDQSLEVIATGHQPIGDVPWPIQIGSSDGLGSKFWILPCDTSFSGDTSWTCVKDSCLHKQSNLGRGSGSSGRGDVSFCETLIKIRPNSNTTMSISMHGCLSDGTFYKTGNLMNTEEQVNSILGKPYATKPMKFIDDGTSDMKEGIFWSKIKMGDHYLVSHGKGFNVWNALVSQQLCTYIY